MKKNIMLILLKRKEIKVYYKGYHKGEMENGQKLA